VTRAGVNVYLGNQLVAGCSVTIINNDANLQYSPGTGGQTVGAISIRRLLRAAGVMPSTVGLVLLTRSSGIPSALDNAELLRPAANFTGNPPAPLVWTDGTKTEYVRPATNGPTDISSVTSTDVVSQTGALDLHVFTGTRLKVSVYQTGSSSGNGSRVQPGSPVHLTASAAGGVSYLWTFSDGQVFHSANISPKFKQGYPVGYVKVTSADGSVGIGWTSLTVQGKAKGGAVPPAKKKSGTTGGVPPTGNTPTTNTTPTTNYPYYGNTYTSPYTTTTPTTKHKHTPPRIKSNGLGQQGGTIVKGLLISDVTPVSPAQVANGNVPPPAPVNERFTQTSVLDNGSVKPLRSPCCSAPAPARSCVRCGVR
jgi:hypothetical protein